MAASNVIIVAVLSVLEIAELFLTPGDFCGELRKVGRDGEREGREGGREGREGYG